MQRAVGHTVCNDDLARPREFARQVADVDLMRHEQDFGVLRQRGKRLQHITPLIGGGTAILKERIQRRLASDRPHVQQFGCFAGTTPLACPDMIKGDACIADRLPDAAGLVPALITERALRAAIVKLVGSPVPGASAWRISATVFVSSKADISCAATPTGSNAMMSANICFILRK